MTVSTFPLCLTFLSPFRDVGSLTAVFAAVKRQPGKPDVNVYSVNITPSVLKKTLYHSLLYYTCHYSLVKEAS